MPQAKADERPAGKLNVVETSREKKVRNHSQKDMTNAVASAKVEAYCKKHKSKTNSRCVCSLHRLSHMKVPLTA